MSQNKPSPRWIVVPGLLVAGLLAALFLREWITIGVIADRKVIASYHFGAGAMVRNGWYYATAERYATTALTEGLVALAVTAAFALAALARSRALAAGAYVLLALGLIANQVFR